ncbi:MULTISPECIES: hypothetical protein [unclassified Leifsonia]|uniref:hypothetical protein n=1 Tax=unclassified Leifsonia TaxID=2663824 RepID=UPI0012F7912D|nr:MULTISPECIES: hypothetical protein [unclassified Leifsonia]
MPFAATPLAMAAMVLSGEADFNGVVLPYVLVPLAVMGLALSTIQVVSVTASRRLISSIRLSLGSDTDIFAILRTPRLAAELETVDEFAASRLRQRLVRYAAISLDDDGIAFWDWKDGAMEVYSVPWARVLSAAPGTTELPADLYRCLDLDIAAPAATMPIVVLDEGRMGPRLTSDTRFASLLDTVRGRVVVASAI